MTIQNLRDVFVEQMKDVYSAEKQMTEALPTMVNAASNPDLKTAFQNHLEITHTQLSRVQGILEKLSVNPGNKKCKAMEGLVEEAGEMAKEKGDSQAIDAGLIAAAQKVEHYEIATYGTLHAWAETLGETEIAETLQSILDEEHDANDSLTDLAESHLNTQAAT